MNLQETVKKILGYHISQENARKFADEQFGLLCSYVRTHIPRQPTKYDSVISESTMLEIDEMALTHGVMLELEDKELYESKHDAVYLGSVFKEIIEHYEKGEVQFHVKTLKQLRELDKLFGYYTYIRVINKQNK